MTKWTKDNLAFTITYFIILTAILFSAPKAFAQEKKISYVQAGETATYAGVLLSPEAFAELQTTVSVSEAKTQARVDYEVTKATLQLQLKLDNATTELKWQEKMWENRLTLKNDQIDDLYKSLKKQHKRTLWDRLEKPVYFSSGIAVSIGMFLLHREVNKIGL